MAYLCTHCRLDDLASWATQEAKAVEEESIQKAAIHICRHLSAFVRWPDRTELLWSGCDRSVNYHSYPESLKRFAKTRSIMLDSRSNGPAVSAYLLAGGERPRRAASSHAWTIHHIYDGQFPYVGRDRSLRARADGLHFTQSAGLVAIHPLADALCAEFAFAAWLLRAHAFLRFGYDPDGVFGERPAGALGFEGARVPTVHYNDGRATA